MAYAKILVPVTGAPTDKSALATAFAAAGFFKAHVEALFVHADPREVAPYIYSGATVSTEVIQSIVDAQRKLTDDAERTARLYFGEAAGVADARIVDELPKPGFPSAAFAVRYGFIPHLVAEAARFSDLIVFKPVEKDERPEFASAIVETLCNAGRPIILSPFKPQANFADNVVIGWDGSDAAARAITAALPFLKRAKKVEVLEVADADHTPPGAGALRNYLALHGVTAALRRVAREGRKTVSACLLEEAAKGGELLVMGGYGHSHFRETFLGGVTLDIVSQRALPVFLMH